MITKILKSGSTITRETPSGPESKSFTMRMLVGIVSTGNTTSVILFETQNWTAQNTDFV